MAEPEEHKPASLWQLMQRGAGGAQRDPEEVETVVDAAEAEQQAAPRPPGADDVDQNQHRARRGSPDPAEAPTAGLLQDSRRPAVHESAGSGDPRTARPKGLWAMMLQSTARQAAPESTPPPAEHDQDDAEPDDSSVGESPAPAEDAASVQRNDETLAETGSVGHEDARPKGLWSLMSEPAAAPAAPVGYLTDSEFGPAEDVPFPEPVAAPADEPQPAPPRSRGAVISVALGAAAIPLAALALLPQFWLKLPATVLGFGALVVGLLANGEIRRSRRRQRGRSLALAGIVLGTAAMLLSPTVFSQLGREFRREYGRRTTRNNLRAVGEALNAFRREMGHFPPGGTAETSEEGAETAMHGWMTHLLPYMGPGERRIHQTILLSKPWDAPENRGPFSEEVPAFYASGADASPSPAGYAVSHFAGLGGAVHIEGVGLANAGVFGRNSRVTAADVTDGLSQTLIAGEIAFDFPPWGHPENWRTIGRGLNKNRQGFGNVDRTGAMFLRADGSVTFISNDIDTQILRKLSTRDGGETVPERFAQ